MSDAFEVHRRTSLYLVLVLACLAVGGGFVWQATEREDYLLIAPAVVLIGLAVMLLRGVGDPRTPLFVADDHGIRLRSDNGWVGLLWSELGELRVEPREGVIHDPRIKVVSSDGRRFYTSPLGLSTNVSPGEAEVQLASRRSAAAY
ncbi:hypothetical protein [Aeromicrobium sp. P5_D10]